MTVYVDASAWKYGRMTMCHMLADTPDELHEMAARIGVDRRHFQPRSTPHYDICRTKRTQAIRFGAVEIDRRRVVRIIREIRRNAQAWGTAA